MLTLQGLGFLRGSQVGVGGRFAPPPLCHFFIFCSCGPNLSWYKFNTSSIGFEQKDHEMVLFSVDVSIFDDFVSKIGDLLVILLPVLHRPPFFNEKWFFFFGFWLIKGWNLPIHCIYRVVGGKKCFFLQKCFFAQNLENKRFFQKSKNVTLWVSKSCIFPEKIIKIYQGNLEISW